MHTPLSTRSSSRRPTYPIAAEGIPYSLKNSSVTQCQIWMVDLSELVLKFAYLGGGTLFYW